MQMKESYVYIISNRDRTVFYVGVTNNLSRRMKEHAEGEGSKFCNRYNVNELVYYEIFVDISNAISREKQIKSWRRGICWHQFPVRNSRLAVSGRRSAVSGLRFADNSY